MKQAMFWKMKKMQAEFEAEQYDIVANILADVIIPIAGYCG